MIGNAHLDPVWLWRWPEGLQAIRATFQSALDRMDESADFVFTSSQAAVYEWLERCDPALFRRIRERVQEGRWMIVGGWWLQPDCNLPSGEGFARQSLYGQRYFEDRFGVRATVGYNVDSFGHAWSLPQILRLSGMHAYVFMRPEPHEKKDLPGHLFLWEGVDGTQVPTFQIPHSYSSSFVKLFPERIDYDAAQLTDELPFRMCFYGVGNHGGGPTKENIRMIEEAAERLADVDIVFSDPAMFFAEVADLGVELPVLVDELQHHASGCYSVHSEIKRNNRRAEHALVVAETMATAAAKWVGTAYPGADLTRAWKGVLFNHFHDILAGTSIKEAYNDARDLHGVSFQLAAETSNLSLQAIAAQIDLSGAGTPLVVWNPHGHRVQGPVILEMWQVEAWSPNPDCMRLRDVNGNDVPFQEVAPSAIVTPQMRRAVTFLADVPATGYTVYWLDEEGVPESHDLQGQESAAENEGPAAFGSGETDLYVEGLTLGNDLLQIAFDEVTGAIHSLHCGDWEVFAGPGAVGVVMADESDTWSHGVFRYDEQVGQFEAARIALVEDGPVRATVEVVSRYNDSELIQRFTLHAGLPWVDVHTVVDWRERHKVLKLQFPVNVESPEATYEVPFGAIERPADGEEEPGMHWFDVSDGEAPGPGLAILNDAKYSYDVSGNTMRLTVLRSPLYAHHVPKEAADATVESFIDQGVQSFTYRLYPHCGSWQEAQIPAAGFQLNQPLTLLMESNHAGRLPQELSLLEIDAPNVLLSALKQAEDGDGTIVRVFESVGQSTPVRLDWRGGEVVIETELRPFEIRTYLIQDGECPGAVEVDLLEHPVDA